MGVSELVHRVSSMLEPCLGNRRETTDALPWYAMYVKSRHEFVTHTELTRKGMDAFLPSFVKISQWKDRKKAITQPLFPGYVFVRIPGYPGAFLDALKTRGSVGFVSLERSLPTPIDAVEIHSLRLLVESGKTLDVYPGLKEGDRVRIKAGILASAEGILTRQQGEYRFWVTVDLLGRSVSVQVAAQDLEAVA